MHDFIVIRRILLLRNISFTKIAVYTFLYLISISCLILFVYINNSSELATFLKKADNFRTDWGFGFYVLIGLIKLVTILVGLTIPIVLTTMLIIQYRKKKTL